MRFDTPGIDEQTGASDSWSIDTSFCTLTVALQGPYRYFPIICSLMFSSGDAKG